MSKFYPNLYKTHLKVGIYTLVIIIVLLFSYVWLTGRMSLNKQQVLRVGFDDVMGLEVGDKIMFRGMETGRVRKIFMQGDRVIVSGMISKEIKLLSGARFYVSDSSLMGGKNLNIIQGQGPDLLAMTKVQTGESPAGIMTILLKASSAVDELTALLDDIRSEGGVLEQGGNLLSNTSAAVSGFDAMTNQMRAELSVTLDKVDRLTGNINQVVETNDATLNRIVSNTPATLGNVNTTLDSLQELSGRLSQTLNSINNGSGTAARLIGDDQLYRRMLDSLNKLDSLITDVQANPRKYIKFSLF